MSVPLLSDMHGDSGSGGKTMVEMATLSSTTGKSSNGSSHVFEEATASADPAPVIAPPLPSFLALGTRHEGFKCDLCSLHVLSIV